MKEILKNELNEYEWNEFLEKVVIKKKYHIYMDEFNNILIYEPIPVKTKCRLDKIIKRHNIQFNNLLIGNELIKKGGLD